MLVLMGQPILPLTKIQGKQKQKYLKQVVINLYKLRSHIHGQHLTLRGVRPVNFIFMFNANLSLQMLPSVKLPRMVCNMWYIEKQQVQRMQPCKTTFATQTQIFVLRPETLQYVTDVYAF
jgi:hypothetical protein